MDELIAGKIAIWWNLTDLLKLFFFGLAKQLHNTHWFISFFISHEIFGPVLRNSLTFALLFLFLLFLLIFFSTFLHTLFFFIFFFHDFLLYFIQIEKSTPVFNYTLLLTLLSTLNRRLFIKFASLLLQLQMNLTLSQSRFSRRRQVILKKMRLFKMVTLYMNSRSDLFVPRNTLIICRIIEWFQTNIIRSPLLSVKDPRLTHYNVHNVQVLIAILSKGNVNCSRQSFVHPLQIIL